MDLISDDIYWYKRSLSKPIGFYENLSRIIKANPVYYKHSEEHKQKMKEVMKGENNGMWKGDMVGYKSLHDWVNRHLPRPEYCPNCNRIKRLYAANISGKYLRDVTDYEYLCQKCHFSKYHNKNTKEAIW